MKHPFVSLTLTLLSTTLLAQSPCLIASYPFDGNALDATGNGHDGIVFGATLATDRFGHVDSCYQFDGVDDWIRLTDTFNSNAGTVSAWISMSDMTTPNYVFSGRDTTMNGIAVELAIDPNTGPDASRLSHGLDRRDCVGGGCNVFFEIGDPQLTPNDWHQVAMSSNGVEVTLYIDCLPVTSYFGSCGDGGGLWFDDLCQDVVYMIGRHKRPLSEHFFTGRIDDVQVYDCALSASEIASLCDLTTSVTQQQSPQPTLYPNPSTGIIHLSPLPYNTEVRVFDATGRIQYSERVASSGASSIDLSGLASGTYFVRAGGDTWTVVRN